jgi:type IV pilus assembly protein PilY1
LWQWDQPYASVWAPNAVPPVVSVVGGVDGVNRAYAGDAEGRVWELDAPTGVDVNNANDGCPSPPCNYAAFDARSTLLSPQPITTNISIARIPRTPDAGSAFASYPSATLLLFGTGGANWVPASVSGSIHAVFQDFQYRVPYRTGGWNLARTINWTIAGAQSYAAGYGVLQEISPGLSTTFATGERVYGTITVTGVKAYFGTVIGPIPSDIMLPDVRSAGRSYFLDLQSASAINPVSTLPVPSFANFGGIAVFHNTAGGDDVIGLQMKKVSKTTDTTGKSAPNAALNPNSLDAAGYFLKSWLQTFFQ